MMITPGMMIPDPIYTDSLNYSYKFFANPPTRQPANPPSLLPSHL